MHQILALPLHFRENSQILVSPYSWITLDFIPFQSYAGNDTYVASNVTQENNAGFKAKSAQKQGKNGLFSGFGGLASTKFQENGDFVHRNSIMRRYLETADGALSAPAVTISRSFPQEIARYGYLRFLELFWIQLFSWDTLDATIHVASNVSLEWNGVF